MPNWAWGCVKVTGKKSAVLAFSKRLIMDDDPTTIDGTKYFARTFTNDTRDYIEGKIQEDFEGKKEDDEATCEIPVDFAWSAYSCIVEGYPQDSQDQCITLPESCVDDCVDVQITTKEPGMYFEEIITCDRDGDLESDCKDLIPMRCKHCGNVESRASFEEPEDLCCSECGESDFEPIEEGEE